MKRQRPLYATDNVKRELIRAERKHDLEVVAGAVNCWAGIDRDPEGRHDYVLNEWGTVVARWNESDHPGLASWLTTRLHERASALRLAQAQGRHSTGQSERGRMSGEARSPEVAHTALARLIKNCLRRGEEPREYVREWLDNYPIGRTALYALIKRIENAPKR